MPTIRRRNPDPSAAGHGHLRSSLADAAWAVEDRVVWGAAELLRGAAEAARWPFERIAWAVEHWVVWPIQEEVSLWGRPARVAALVATSALAVAGVAAGIAVSNPSSGAGGTVVEASAPSPASSPAAATAGAAQSSAAKAPELHGAAPTFAPESGGGVPKSKLGAEAAPGDVTGEGTTGAAVPAPGTGAGSGGPEVAGPAAIKVAREFAGAFVLYETGHESPEVKATFERTTTPDLSKALLERPPRLPANVNVPEAKVLNIVAGPRHGNTYTLSVSLLRVGITSELRIDMQKSPAGGGGAGGAGEEEQKVWRVTDVLG
jgi:hypothetical protein